MRDRVGGGGEYFLKELNEKHKLMLYQVAMGKSVTEVAKEFDVTRPWLSVIRNSDVGKEYIKAIRSRKSCEAVVEAVSSLKGLTREEIIQGAMDVLWGIAMDRHELAVQRIKAASEILDRSGMGKVQRYDVRQSMAMGGNLDAADMSRLRDEALERGKDILKVFKEEGFQGAKEVKGTEADGGAVAASAASAVVPVVVVKRKRGRPRKNPLPGVEQPVA